MGKSIDPKDGKSKGTDTVVANTVYGTNNHSSMDQSGMASPLLFGSGGGLWSTGQGFRNGSPSYGQGG